MPPETPRRQTLVVALIGVLLLLGCIPRDASPPAEVLASGMDLPATESLLVVGDWGTGDQAQELVASAMETAARNLDVAAIVTTGDNFYSNDAEALMEPYEWATERDIPFLISWGNHDIETERRAEVVNETFDEPPRWALHEWGDLDLIFLDSNQVESSAQIDFMTTAMAAGDDPTIMVFHHPPYSCGSHGNTAKVIDTWVTRFDGDVFLVLNGHEHNYQRFEAAGVGYVVTGGGGATLTELAACQPGQPDRLAGESALSFITLEQSDGAVHMTAVDADGIVIDETTFPLP